MLNPNGVEYAHEQVRNGETDQSNLWRKNREPNHDELGYTVSYGVDLNRNYGFHWGELGYHGYVNSERKDYIGPVDKVDTGHGCGH